MSDSLGNVESIGSTPDEPRNTCAICCGNLDKACATTKCNHVFCTECLLNSMAKNPGTEEGTTRTKCPLCREQICDDVVPSTRILIHMKDLEDELKAERVKAIRQRTGYRTTLGLYKTECRELVNTNKEVVEKCNIYKQRSVVQSKNIVDLVTKCSLIERAYDQKAQQLLELEEQIKMTKYQVKLKAEIITKLRNAVPKKDMYSLELEEQLKMSNYQVKLRGETITKLRNDVPKKHTYPYNPHFVFTKKQPNVIDPVSWSSPFKTPEFTFPGMPIAGRTTFTFG